MLADRIGVVEGIMDDLKKGHVPNIFAELGWPAEWKHNKKGFLLKMALIGAGTAVAVSLLTSKKKTEDED